MSAPLDARAITVVSTRAWVADELATNRRHPVRRSFGLDVPADAESSAWWMPAEHAARLLAQGVPLALTSPGAAWLSTDVPAALLGRAVHTTRLCDVPRDMPGTGELWCKPAEAKIPSLPMALRSREALLAASVSLPDDAIIQWTQTTLDLSIEFRCHIIDRAVVAISPYLLAGTQTYYDMTATDWVTATRLMPSARAFAAEAVLSIARQPSAYCLDVGYDRASGSWLVVEANPAWCSAWYGCAASRDEMDAVAAAIVRSCQRDAEWAWRPDPYLTERADAMRPLPVVENVTGGAAR